MSVQSIGGGSLDSFYQNRAWTLPFELYDNANVPLDLSGADITFVIAESGSSTPMITKVTGDGIFVLDAANGKIVVVIPDTDTNYVGTYAYELVVDIAGKTTYGSGFMLVRPSIEVS